VDILDDTSPEVHSSVIGEKIPVTLVIRTAETPQNHMGEKSPILPEPEKHLREATQGAGNLD
jgi:hypothetical protein